MCETALTVKAAPLDPAAVRARLTGRSWWALLLGDGAVLPEWKRDWLDLPQQGRRALRLACPSGQIATLDDGRDISGRCVQLKVAVAGAGGGRATWAHLIGLITDPASGACVCAVWDYRTRTLSTFTDCAYHMAYENIGPLCPEHLGLRRP